MSFSFSLKAKKTPFQRQKEIEEEKRKRDDEEAAKVYEDFVKDFGEDVNHQNKKSFVRGGIIQHGRSGKEATPAPGGKRHYAPSSAPRPPAVDADSSDSDDEAAKQAALQAAARGRLRSIDLLLEDLKKDQAKREQERETTGERPTYGENPHTSASEASDQGSTNLFVGNLAPDVDESMLLREFGRFGPIGSVKVMWPRDEEQRRRGRNTGFVAFMRHEDAGKAKDALDGVILRELPLTIGWGKAVPLPPVPVWPPRKGLSAGDDDDGMIKIPAAAPESTRQRMHDGPPPKRVVVGRGQDIEIAIPSDPRQRFVIEAMAFYVLRDGCEFEQAVMEREASNPEFAFLFDVRCPEHAYYRWRIFSVANGDTLRSWRVDPFLMVSDSNRWIPPPMTLVATTERSTAQRVDPREDCALPDAARDRLLDLLKNLTVDRRSICEAMVYVLDHADCAADVAEILVDSLTSPDTPFSLRIARLFLMSDVLYNTSAPVRNASKYRSRLQGALPDVFESLQETYRTADGRMAQELLRKHVLKVLRVWRGWYIFGDDFLNGLQATFLRGAGGPAGTKSSAAEAEAEAIDPKLKSSLEASTEEEIAVKCKHTGLSRQGGKEAMISRLLALDIYLNAGQQTRQESSKLAVSSQVKGNEAGDETEAKQSRPSVEAAGWQQATADLDAKT